MTAYGTGRPENPDFPIKIKIFHSATCGWYFHDLSASIEPTHAKTYACTRWTEMKGVVHSHSDAKKIAKKNRDSSPKKHILVRFERWNSLHVIYGMQYAHISGFVWNRRDGPTCNNAILEFPKKNSFCGKIILQNNYVTCIDAFGEK